MIKKKDLVEKLERVYIKRNEFDKDGEIFLGFLALSLLIGMIWSSIFLGKHIGLMNMNTFYHLVVLLGSNMYLSLLSLLITYGLRYIIHLIFGKRYVEIKRGEKR